MKIAFIDFAGPDFPGGCEKYFSILANHFSSKNDVKFIEFKKYVQFMEFFYHFLSGHKIGNIDYVKRDIGKSERINVRASILIPFSEDYKKIKKILEDSDLIYSKNEFQELLFLYVLLGKKNFSKKIIIGIHSSIFIPNNIRGIWKIIHDIQYNSIFYKIFLNSAKSIHVINKDYKEKIHKTYGVDKKNIIYIPYFIDWKTTISKKNINEKFVVFWGGRLTQQKGLERLFEIINNLSEFRIFNKIEVWIAGGGEQESQVQMLSKKYLNVKYLGFVVDVLAIYSKADLSIVTSFFETFGYNVLEPQSFGTPVVAYDIEGPRDIIENGRTGFLVKDTNEFIDSIIKILNNPNKFSRNIIYKIINEKFSKEKILKSMEKKLFTI